MSLRISKLLPALLLTFVVSAAFAQTCSLPTEMDANTRSSAERAAQDYFGYAARGDSASLQRYAIPGLAGNFGGITQAIQDNKDTLASARPNLEGTYLLDATGGAAVLDRAEFNCGVFNSPARIGFNIPNLPAGKYAIVIMEAQGAKAGTFVSTVLQDMGGQWKLAGLYIRPEEIAAKNGHWYWTRAREFKNSGQRLNSWFYYLTAADLISPVPFIVTPGLDKLYEEQNDVQPQGLPQQAPVSMNANGKSYQITEVFPVPSKDGLDLVLKYKAPDISNTSAVHADNLNLIKAWMLKYPELRSSFSNVVARAVAPSGQDFGSMLAVKDIK